MYSENTEIFVPLCCSVRRNNSQCVHVCTVTIIALCMPVVLFCLRGVAIYYAQYIVLYVASLCVEINSRDFTPNWAENKSFRSNIASLKSINRIILARSPHYAWAPLDNIYTRFICIPFYSE